MINQEDLFNRISDLGIDFVTGVPDSLLNDFVYMRCHILMSSIIL